MTLKARFLHAMLHVGDLDRSIGFYVGTLGMRVLRRGDFPEEGRANAFVGYGEEADTTVVELTQHRGVATYDHGTAFGHLAIGVSDIVAACTSLRAAGAKITREPWTIPSGKAKVAFAEDPDGYALELVQRFD